MREASSLVLAARLQGEGASVAPTTRWPSGRAGELLPERRAHATPPRRRSRAPTRRSWSPSGRSSPSSTGQALAGRMANPLLVDGRNFLDPRRAARRRLRLRGHRRDADGGRGELMQALVLVGGEGTRLRPLTLTQPKPALPLVDRPFIRYMVDWLARHGVDEVVMACGFRRRAPARGARRLGPGGPRIRYIEEPEPLGTAGPVRLAADEGLLGDRFLVLNGDVLTDLDLERAAARARGDGRGGHARAASGRRPELLRPRQRRADDGRSRCSGSSRSPTRPRSTPTRSTPAPTCSSARCSS